MTGDVNINIRIPNANDENTDNQALRKRCTRGVDGCRGNCEVFESTFRGREVLYPDSFGSVTAGVDKGYFGRLPTLKHPGRFWTGEFWIVELRLRVWGARSRGDFVDMIRGL